MEDTFVRSLTLCLALGLVSASVRGQDEEAEARAKYQEHLNSFDWQEGPTSQLVGTHGCVAVGEGRRSLGSSASQRLIESFGNLPGGTLAMVTDESVDWWVDFEFEDCGYIKDDEKDDLDADDLLETLKESNREGNKARKERGLDSLELVGWAEKPHFDDDIKALTWAVRFQSSTGETINHNVRILGRRGVMIATYVATPDDYQAHLSEAREIIKGFAYSSGNRYSEFTKGDKVAEYGLAALITGGGLAVLAKTGLLKKFWKLIVVAVVAVGGFFKKLFGRGGERRVKRSVSKRTSA